MNKKPLGPFVVLGIIGLESGFPGKTVSDLTQLAVEILLGTLGVFFWVTANLDCMILRVDSEAVKPDRFEYVLSLHAFKPAVNVRAGECVHIADMESFGRRIREHHEIIKRPAPSHSALSSRLKSLPKGFLRSREVRLMDLFRAPFFLPERFDCSKIVFFH